MKLAASATAFALMAGPAGAANHDDAERALKRFFEGHPVVVRVDLPATSEGVDVYPEREDPLDFSKLGGRVRSSGVAVRERDRITITQIKVKDDLIEFQLGGGGFSNWRDSSASVSVPAVPKSGREHDLEREVKQETDHNRKRRLQRELDDERRDREAEDARNRAVAEAANEMRRERDRERALDMGSRFNIRFERDVPPAYLSPEGVMRALERYVDFLDLGPRPPERAEDLRAERVGEGPVHKGMSRNEIEDRLGAPTREDRSREGTFDVLVAAYSHDRDRIEVTYVEEVAVRVTPLRRR